LPKPALARAAPIVGSGSRSILVDDTKTTYPIAIWRCRQRATWLLSSRIWVCRTILRIACSRHATVLPHLLSRAIILRIGSPSSQQYGDGRNAIQPKRGSPHRCLLCLHHIWCTMTILSISRPLLTSQAVNANTACFDGREGYSWSFAFVYPRLRRTAQALPTEPCQASRRVVVLI
jgi:hypothetical protein